MGRGSKEKEKGGRAWDLFLFAPPRTKEKKEKEGRGREGGGVGKKKGGALNFGFPTIFNHLDPFNEREEKEKKREKTL